MSAGVELIDAIHVWYEARVASSVVTPYWRQEVGLMLAYQKFFPAVVEASVNASPDSPTDEHASVGLPVRVGNSYPQENPTLTEEPRQSC